jgi:hypothetical protein
MPEFVSYASRGTGTSAAATAARASACRAADQAGVAVRRLDTLGDARSAEQLFSAAWRPADGHSPVRAELIRAVLAADAYAVGAFVGRTLVARVGFWASPGARLLHSHITCVASDHRRRRVGFALKLDQRASPSAGQPTRSPGPSTPWSDGMRTSTFVGWALNPSPTT